MTALIYFILLFVFVYRCDADCEYKFMPKYHLSNKNWMNDPNGFCIFNDEYHLFYQHNPNSSTDPGIAHWGHAISKDLVSWQRLPIALYPDKPYDKDGVFSGSGVVINNTMYLYYTSNLNHPGETPDHEQHQCLATSTDGRTFTKDDRNPIIYGENRQPNFRDPKVWIHNDTWYMVLGNSFNNDTLGRVLLYSSKDGISWKEASILAESSGFLGYMWECPDFFELDGKWVLLFSPQGVEPQGDKFNNLYATGYIVGDFDYDSLLFTALTEFMELDHGHDFYATQTIINKHGKRIVIAWNDMWNQNYPEALDGFTGQMTLARVLKLIEGLRLAQTPVTELKSAVGKKIFSGMARSGTKIELVDNAAKIEVKSARLKDFILVLESCNNDTVTISYNYRRGQVSLDRGGSDGVRRTQYRPKEGQKLNLIIYYDHSSLELFWGQGEVTMSSRVFLTGVVSLFLPENSHADELDVSEMLRTISCPDSEEFNVD